MKHHSKIGLLCLAMLATASTAQARDKIKMATIAPGSTAYSIMTSMATTVNMNQDAYEITVDATGLGTKQMVDAGRGRLDLAMATPATLDLMANGQSMFKNLPEAPELHKNLGLVFWFPFGTFHIATHADAGMTSLSDLKGKKVFLGQPGGGEYHVANQWIESVTGYKAGRDYTPIRATWGSAVLAFENKEIDVYVAAGKPPFKQMAQLTEIANIRFLGLSKAEANTISGRKDAASSFIKAQGRSFGVIPRGSYGDAVVNREDVYSLATNAGVVARLDLDEDAVYQITKTFWNNLSEATKTNADLSLVTPRGAFALETLKLHPGALKFYGEAGIKVPSELR